MPLPVPTYAEFIDQYPAFNSLSLVVVNAQIRLSARLLSSGAWGEFYNDAIGLDTAHNLALAQLANSGITASMQGAAGPITSTSAAGVSISFAQPAWNQKSKADNWYMKTTYGQQFLRLRDTIMPLACM